MDSICIQIEKSGREVGFVVVTANFKKTNIKTKQYKKKLQ